MELTFYAWAQVVTLQSYRRDFLPYIIREIPLRRHVSVIQRSITGRIARYLCHMCEGSQLPGANLNSPRSQLYHLILSPSVLSPTPFDQYSAIASIPPFPAIPYPPTQNLSLSKISISTCHKIRVVQECCTRCRDPPQAYRAVRSILLCCQ